MRYLYYCNSAYQLLNVLNLHWQRKYNRFEDIKNYCADLIVLNSFKAAKEMTTIINKKNYFDNVELVDRVDKTSRIINIVNLFFPMHLIKKAIKNTCFHKRNNYDYICAPKFSWITAAIWQINKRAKLTIHEDGIGTYNVNMSFKANSRLYSYLYKIMNNNRIFENYESIYVNSKKLYCFVNDGRDIEIPRINDAFLKEINSIFADMYETRSNDIYFLSQFGEYNIKKPTLDYLCKYKNRVIFCPHPRYDNNCEYDFETMSNKNIWELYVCNTPDFNNKCLIAVHSTAVFSPKILFDKEPFIILLYKLLDHPYKGLDYFIKKFTELYEDREKIMIPKTLEELYGFIDSFARIKE